MSKVLSPQEALELRRKRTLETFQLDPQVPIELKGKPYILELTNFAVKGILKDTGHNILSVGFGVEQMQDPEMMGALLRWALELNHPDLTQDDVDRMFSYRHYGYILEKLKAALDLFLPDMSDVQIEGARPNVQEGEDPS